jgi:hypothetical protein
MEQQRDAECHEPGRAGEVAAEMVNCGNDEH